MTLEKFLSYRERAIELALTAPKANRELFTNVMEQARIFDKEQETYELMKSKAEEFQSPELWELPKEFEEQVPMQKFNPDYLPPVLRDYLKAVAEYAQVDVEMCVLPLLSVLSLCVQGKAVVKHPINSHTQPLSLYTLTVAPPGEKKSGVLKEFKRPVEEFQKAYNNAHALDFAEYASKIELLERQRAVAIKKGDEVTLKDCDRDLLALKQNPVCPVKFSLDDVTPESLANEMYRNGNRMGILASEGAVIDILTGIYSNGVSNISLFLESYDGNSYDLSRQTRGQLHLENPLLAIGLMVQPSMFSKAVTNAEFSGRGFIQRFMFAFPESRIETADINSPDIPESINRSYVKLITDLLNMPKNQGIPVMQFNNNAVRLLTDYYYHIRGEITNGILKDIREWSAKHFGRTQRIAGILHLCTHKPSELIDEDTAMKAVNIALWAENQAYRAFGNTAFEDETAKNAKYVLKKIREKKQSVYTKREILRLCQRLKSSEVDGVLETLDDMKYIRLIEERTKTKVKTSVKVNPLVFESVID